MKVTITKEFDPIKDQHYFFVQKDGITAGCFIFHPLMLEESSVYNEEANRKAAYELAKRIEQFGDKRIVETIYETETPPPTE